MHYDSVSNEWWLPTAFVVRITPNYGYALRTFDLTECWAGMIEKPFREIPILVEGQTVRLHECVDQLPMNALMLSRMLRLDADPTY